MKEGKLGQPAKLLLLSKPQKHNVLPSLLVIIPSTPSATTKPKTGERMHSSPELLKNRQSVRSCFPFCGGSGIFIHCYYKIGFFLHPYAPCTKQYMQLPLILVAHGSLFKADGRELLGKLLYFMLELQQGRGHLHIIHHRGNLFA
jgi:hypothetical protein